MAINLRECECEFFAFESKSKSFGFESESESFGSESESKSSKCVLESTVGHEYYITEWH